MDGQWGTLRCRRSLAAAHASFFGAIDGPCRQLVRSWAASGNKCERQRTRPTHDEKLRTQRRSDSGACDSDSAGVTRQRPAVQGRDRALARPSTRLK